MTVSACIIVRDEWDDLRRCLRSLQRVDEVIVVRQDDFALARNHAAEMVTSDWLFYIDADEALEGDMRLLCDKLPPEVDGCLIPINSLESDDGQEGVIGQTAQQFRLVRNGIGARFEGRIHEQIVLPDGRLPRLAHVKGLSFTHWGYLPERRKGKHLRNLTLLRKAIEDQPVNPYNHFQLGVQHATTQDFNESLSALREAIALWQAIGDSAPYVPTMFTSAIFAALRTGQHAEAVKIAASAPKEAFTPDYFYYTALASLELGLEEEAAALLVRGREARPNEHFSDPNTLIRIELALAKLG